jgi:hypothetical protein
MCFKTLTEYNIYNLNEGVRAYGYGVYRHFHEYFSYVVAVSFICGGNQSTRRKPQTCLKSLVNFIT